MYVTHLNRSFNQLVLSIFLFFFNQFLPFLRNNVFFVTFIQVDKNHGNNLHDVKAKTTKRISDESVSGEDDVREDSNKVENEGKPGKRTSRRVTSKRDMGQVSLLFNFTICPT